MKKKISVVLAAAVFICGILPVSGCSKKESVELTVWCSENVLDIMDRVAASFIEENKNEADIKINVGIEHEDSVSDTVMLNPANAADIYSFADDQMARLCGANALLPITLGRDEVIAQSGGEGSAAVQCGSFGGELYGIPFTAGNGFFMFYNADYFTDEDVLTFDRMLEIADKSGKKIAMDWSSGWYTYAFFGGAGLDLRISDDGTYNICNWDAEDVKYTGVDVAEGMLSISAHESFLDCTNDELTEMLENGDTEIIAAVNGIWNMLRFRELWGDSMRASKLPTYTLKGDQVQMTSFAGYILLGINSATKHPDWAMKLAEYIANYDNQLLRYRELGVLPAHVGVAELPEVQEYPIAKALSDQAHFATRQMVAGSYWNAMTEFGTIMASGNPDGLDLKKVIEKLVSKISSPD